MTCNREILPSTPFTCSIYRSTPLYGAGDDQCKVKESDLIHARETSGASGTSTPSVLMSDGRSVHRTFHALCSNLRNKALVKLIPVLHSGDARRTNIAPHRSLSTELKTCICVSLWHDLTPSQSS